VNDRLAPLSRQLESGERVTIITSEVAQPNPNWLNFVVSAKARSAIRHFLKNQRHNESVDLGARMLNQALKPYQLSLEALAGEKLDATLREANIEALDTLLEDIGLGKRSAAGIASKLAPESSEASAKAGTLPLVIDSAEAMVISFAKCCRPIPGDTVAAHISTGKGLVVHQESCRNLTEIRNSKPDAINPISWSEHVRGEFTVGLRVEVGSERGIVAQLATRIADQQAGIEKIQVNERNAANMVIQLDISVRDRIHLANIMRRLRVLRSVIRVSRSKN
jgi:(p)ppGpp synthase/HD superfamily hydrolase